MSQCPLERLASSSKNTRQSARPLISHYILLLDGRADTHLLLARTIPRYRSIGSCCGIDVAQAIFATYQIVPVQNNPIAIIGQAVSLFEHESE
jgi:hypothetical protein